MQLAALDQLEQRIAGLRGADCGAGARAPSRRSACKTIAGVGPTTAAAMVATVGEPQEFRNGRQFAAWLGLTPKQHSTGGKTRLGRITRRGDAYLRTLLILGAKSALQAALRKPPELRHRLQRWIVEVFGRIGYHKTLVAIANKHARIIWALLVKGEDFDVRRLAPVGSGSSVTEASSSTQDCAKGECDNRSDRRLRTQTNLPAAIKADDRMWGKRAVLHNGPRQHHGAEVGYRVAVCPSLSSIQLRVAPTGKSI